MAWKDEYEAMVKALRENRTVVKGEMLERLTKKCQENLWLKVGGADFEPHGFCCEGDYEYSLIRYDDINMLRLFFEHGNWAIRQGVQYRDLIFVNQVNGGDEWWTLKVADDRLIAFESITMRGVIRHGDFAEYIERMVRATSEQCEHGNY